MAVCALCGRRYEHPWLRAPAWAGPAQVPPHTPHPHLKRAQPLQGPAPMTKGTPGRARCGRLGQALCRQHYFSESQTPSYLLRPTGLQAEPQARGSKGQAMVTSLGCGLLSPWQTLGEPLTPAGLSGAPVSAGPSHATSTLSSGSTESLVGTSASGFWSWICSNEQDTELEGG